MLVKNFYRFLGAAFVALFFSTNVYAQTNLGNMGYFLSSVRVDACENSPATFTNQYGTYTFNPSSCSSTTTNCYTAPYTQCTLAKYYNAAGSFWGYHAYGYATTSSAPTLCPHGNGGDGRCYASAGEAAACSDEFDPETLEHCITGTPYDHLGFDSDGYDDQECMAAGWCEGDSPWVDRDGYDSNDCIASLCPTDEGWTDAEGYDYEGFDSNGVDRGGNDYASGGGYSGSAGTGGTPPAGYVPYSEPDYANGDNQDNRGNLVCDSAYPIYLEKQSIEPAVLDGLGACINACQYYPTSTFWDFDSQTEQTLMSPSGLECQISDVAQSYTAIALKEPTIQAPPEGAEHLNYCYGMDGFFYCKAPTESNPTCYKNRNGALGALTTCSQSSQSNNVVCGVAQGVYQCLPLESRCESFYGEIHCLDPDGNYISDDSPDHILNGGNGDGDDANDVFADANDVMANGTNFQDKQLAQLSARGIAREISGELKPSLDNIANALNQSSDVIDGEATANNAAGVITDALQGVGDVGSGLGYDDNLLHALGFAGGMFSSGNSCQQIHFDILPSYGMAIDVDTCSLELIRLIIEFILYGSSLYTLYILALRGHA